MRLIYMMHILIVLFLVFPVPLLAEMDFDAADLDGDGYLTIEDLRVLGTERSTLAGAYRGDVDGNGRVDDGDVRALARILLTGSGRRQGEKAVVEDFIRYVVGREDETPNPADRDSTQSDGGLNRVRKDLDRNREQLQVKKLKKIYEQTNPGSRTVGNPVRPASPTDQSTLTTGSPAGGSNRYRSGVKSGGLSGGGEQSGPGTRPGGGSVGGVADLNQGGQGRGRGKAPEMSREAIQKSVSRIDAVVSLDRIFSSRDLDITVEAINAHRNRLLATSATSKLEQIFSSAAGKNLDSLDPSEHPDSRMIRERGAGHDTAMVTPTERRNETKGSFYPRSSFDLEVEKNQAETPGVTARVGSNNSKTLDEVYRPVSPTVNEGEQPSTQLEQDVKTLSDDPYMSQILKSVTDPATFITSVGGDSRSGPKSRGETLVAIFNPDTARTILSGGSSSLGLDPASTFVQRYVPIADELIPILVDTGTISQGEADTMINEIHNIQNTLNGGGNNNSSGLDSFLDALGGIAGGDPGGVMGGLQPGDIASVPGGVGSVNSVNGAVTENVKPVDSSKPDLTKQIPEKKVPTLMGDIGSGIMKGLKYVAPIAPISPIALVGGVVGGAAKGAYDHYSGNSSAGSTTTSTGNSSK